MQMKLMRAPVGYIRYERKREDCGYKLGTMSWVCRCMGNSGANIVNQTFFDE